jgi:polysaccharide biosynthesis/export protein
MFMLLLLTTMQVAPAADADRRLYVVGPNDVLTVSVYNQEKLSGKYVVEADGTIAYPLLGRVVVGALSIRAVEDKLRAGLAAGFLNDPQVSVTIDQYRSQQVFVTGEVRQLPANGALQFTGTMTLIEALARVGSTTDRAGSEVVIVRSAGARSSSAAQPTAPSAETIRVNLQKLQSGAVEENVLLQAGDTIFVPRAETVFVSGQVRTPGEYVIHPGMTVRQVLALAGGVTDRGSERRVQIIRMVQGKEVTIGADPQQTVQAGDTIVVRERLL